MSTTYLPGDLVRIRHSAWLAPPCIEIRRTPIGVLDYDATPHVSIYCDNVATVIAIQRLSHCSGEEMLVMVCDKGSPCFGWIYCTLMERL